MNAQLPQKVKQLKGKVHDLTIGVNIECEFPFVNKIVEDYTMISSNYRLNLTSEIMNQSKTDEKIKGIFLARFAHCVSFTILKLSYQFVQSYWDNQLEYLQKPFGFSNKQTAQKHLQTIFQQQFNSSFIQLYSQGRQFITLKLKEQIVEENENFAYLFDSILNTTSKQEDDKINNKKNALIESCLQNMWNCLLSTPSLQPYPLEFLGKENGCNDIGYFTWPSLIRCDTNDLLD
ncbi:hypothetical protein RFI_09813, partial [Reticulomyxa filosa]